MIPILKTIVVVAAICSAAAGQTTQSATTRPTKQLYFDVGTHQPTWRARLPVGFLPAVVEAGGRYFTANGKEDSYFVGGYNGPNDDIIPAKLRYAVAALPPGTLYVYDQERPAWSTDIRSVEAAVAATNRKRFVDFANTIHETNASVRVSFYGILPFGDYWMTTRQYNARKIFERWQAGAKLNDDEKWAIAKAYRWEASGYVLDEGRSTDAESRFGLHRWQAANDHDAVATRDDGSSDAAAGMVAAVDALTPSLYDFYVGDDTEGYVYEMIAEARRISNGRPVYPFVWPVYHNSNPTDGGKTIPLDEWRAHVRRVLRLADGCVLWGADPVKHREHIRVLLEEAEFASREPAAK